MADSSTATKPDSSASAKPKVKRQKVKHPVVFDARIALIKENVILTEAQRESIAKIRAIVGKAADDIRSALPYEHVEGAESKPGYDVGTAVEGYKQLRIATNVFIDAVMLPACIPEKK